MYDRILVPTDGSDCAAVAIEHALELARRYEAEVHVLFVVDVRMGGQGNWAVDADNVFEAIREHGESVVEGVAEKVREADVPVTTTVVTGTPATEICDYADEERCDLVVMGTHGRSGLSRYLLGSVAERVVRQSDAPVMTVRAES
ncbi:universal stress protein [Halogeometricum limi]|uniref:Nucleotide-binding universal stress protein, UspA family n=1 Tax=Halogeometricum limi TaxID=555875 RepID=A0A1I6GPB7_9EURY|nr:universal stress protein [Halogeometricum limi]SFR44034.1 Nucleotide-binding universal stress protein, UspA family [Halogeometricum limi]